MSHIVTAVLIAGATPDLPSRARDGDVRGDLFHALSVAVLTLPPLRARRADLPLLAQRVLLDVAARHNKPAHGFTDEALGFLAAHDWPGNLRELEAEITRMLIFAQTRTLGAELISRPILQAAPPDAPHDAAEDALMAGDGTLKERIERIEARILRETLTRHKWNKSRASAELGLSRVGLRAKLDRYGVHPPTETPEEA